MSEEGNHRDGWQMKVREVIFEADTPMGKAFDVSLIVLIIASVAAVMLDSVASIRADYGDALHVAEWVFTILFTIEYVLRLVCIGKPLKYATSFFGIVDLLAILPTYISLLIAGSQYLMVVRVLRVLRVFRVLKVVQYVGEARVLMLALRQSRRKIVIFLFFICTLVIVLGSLMYLIEGEEHGFTSIPQSVYWAIVTITTVGYGDMAPETVMGQAVAVVVMILGFSIIAVPTGIITVGIQRAMDQSLSTRVCPECSREGHDNNADFCKYCGEKL